MSLAFLFGKVDQTVKRIVPTITGASGGMVWKMGVQNIIVKIHSSTFYTKVQIPSDQSRNTWSNIPIKTEHIFLEVPFQRNDTYNSHIQQIHRKCLKRLNVIWLLTGTSWGAAKQPLLNIYRALVLSVIEYGMEAFFLLKSSLDKLNKIKYETLRLYTGTMRSTPTFCLLQASGEIPLHVKHKLLCLKYKAHLLTFNNHPALLLIADSWHELYPNTPSFQSFNMATKDTVSPDTFKINPLNISNIPPWIHRKINIDLSLTHTLHSQNPEIIKRTALYHLQENYPDFVYIYTDGSKTAEKKQEARFACNNVI